MPSPGIRKGRIPLKNAILTLTAALLILMLTVPALSVRTEEPENLSPDPAVSQDVPLVKSSYFRVLDTATDRVEKISEWDYVWGVVAAEMGYTYSPEALKAQTIAAYTLAVRARGIATTNKETYDLTNDSTKHQAFMTAAAAKSNWGKSFEENQKKIAQAMEEVWGLVLTYEDQPIFAAYHAISGGRTEAAKTVWGGDYPYLQPVESVGDLMAEQYLTTVKYTPEAFVERAKALDLNLKPEDASKFAATPERSESGMVTAYTLGGKTFTGSQMRTAFGLRSANFDLVWQEGELVFTVRGYGHGVGMSQQGAEHMAKQGSTYKEILSWYYKDCKIQEYAKLKK